MNKKLLTAIMFLGILASASYAAKWETMTFGEDISASIEELSTYCLVHDMKLEDILWANKTDKDSLQPGQVIYLPANHADMLSIWQNIGAWQPTALVPVTSAAAAKKVSAPEPKPEPKPASVTPASAPAPKPEPKPVPAPAPVTVSKAPEEPIKIQNTTKQPVPTPANVIKETAKPDKILTAKPKSPQQEIPGLMDPIIILSPNGDPTHGPMRLMISGDKVEVVRLPQNAAPKRPSMADLDHTFGTSPNYLRDYDVSNLPKRNNYVPPNMVNLNGKMLWPVDGRVSSPFGPRGGRKHQGIDIPMPKDTPIRAAATGIVARTGNNSTIGFRGYGNFVLIDHGNGMQTFYAHCSSTAVHEGQRIMQGQIIGYVGCTGRSTANHLHFEVRVNDIKVDPMPYLAGNARLASHK